MSDIASPNFITDMTALLRCHADYVQCMQTIETWLQSRGLDLEDLEGDGWRIVSTQTGEAQAIVTGLSGIIGYVLGSVQS